MLIRQTVTGFGWGLRMIRNHISVDYLNSLQETVDYYQNEQPGVTDRPSQERWEAMRDCVQTLRSFVEAVERFEKPEDGR